MRGRAFRGDGAGVGREVRGGDLDGEEEEAGAFVVDLIAGDAVGDLGDGELDGVAVLEVGQREAFGGKIDDG